MPQIDKRGCLHILWSYEDVQSKGMDMSVCLSKKDALLILEDIGRTHDASIGVNWDVIEEAITYFINERERQSLDFIKTKG